MRKFLFLMFALVALGSLSACGTVDRVADSDGGELVFQYATAKVIRETDVTADAVLSFADRVRPLLDTEVHTVDAVMEAVRAEIEWENLLPEDRILVNYIFNAAEDRLKDRAGSSPDEIRTSATTIIGWIEQAAILSGGR